MREVGRKEDGERCSTRGILLPSLRELRQGAGLSQRDLGKLANVSTATVYRLENLLRGAYPVTVRKLARALGVPPAELVLARRLAEGEREG